MAGSFDLRISVTGMCLFVPDPAPPGGATPAVHVLLPAITDADHVHHARLLYDTAYEAKGAKQLTRRRVCMPLDGHSLVPPVPAGAALETVLTDEIVNLTAVTGKKVPRALLGGDPGVLLKARLSFRGGATTDYELGEMFTFVTGLDRMTWKVEWTIRGLPGDRLEWSLQPFGDASLQPAPLRDLYPIGGVVRVSVHNVMCLDLPRGRPHEAPDEPAEHFPGYYKLLGSNKTDTPVHAKIQIEELSDCDCMDPPDADTEPGGGETGTTEADGGCGCGDTPRNGPDGTEGPDDPETEAAAGDVSAPQPMPDHILSVGNIGGRPVTCIVAQGEPGP